MNGMVVLGWFRRRIMVYGGDGVGYGSSRGGDGDMQRYVACDDEVEVMMGRRLEMFGVATAYLPEKNILVGERGERIFE
ncbi:hypothetical protein Tco_0403932 [Tanacetum coccineum]